MIYLFFLTPYNAFADFFQNSHHITISGGNFISSANTTISNPVVHDPVVREQSVCSFLFFFLLPQIHVPNNSPSDVAQDSSSCIYPMRRFIFLSGSQ